MKRVFLSVFLIGFSAAALAKMFDRRECGVRFEMPAGRVMTVEKPDHGGICDIVFEPKNKAKLIEKDGGVDRSGASVEIFAAPLEIVIEKETTFEQRDGAWKIHGRHGMESEAREISGPGWKGVRGTSESGCHFEEGGYAGLCPVEVAVISNGSRTALIIANERSLPDLEKILAKFQFR